MTTPAADTPTVSKVTFSPVSDSTGNEALIVTIKTVTPQAEDIPKVMERARRSMSFDSKKIPSDMKRKTRSRALGNSKSTMTEPMPIENQATGSSGDASSPSEVVSCSSGVGSSPSEVVSDSYGIPSPSKFVPSFTDTPCLKHAAENISRKASGMKSEKVSMCNNCSKSMLSYIFVVQDFLESLAKEIVGQSDSQSCVQCLRLETRRSVSGIEEDGTISRTGDKKASKSRARDVRGSKSEEQHSSKHESHTYAETPTREVRRYEETSDQLIERSISQHRQAHLQDQTNLVLSNVPNLQGNVVPSNQQVFNQGFQSTNTGEIASSVGGQQAQDYISSQDGHIGHRGVDQEIYLSPHEMHKSNKEPHEVQPQFQGHQNQQKASQPHAVQERKDKPNQQSDYQTYTDEPTLDEQIPTRRSFDRHRPDHRRDVESSVFGDTDVDGVMSALSNAEREVYDNARNISGWEGLGEDAARNISGWESLGEDAARNISGMEGLGEDSTRNISGREGPRLVSSLPSPLPREAYVTMCRNNAEALGCLVVGTSLLLSRTTRTLCVLMSDGVSNAFRGPLSCVFHSVVCARSLDSLGSTKLSLLEQPELGVSFEKLNVWRLLQFDKCVFLNPDTLVLQNCDELFCRNELSAVSDVGWPDCFNSGVFVFVPSQQTFWNLVDYAEKNGSYDGGDQGLLNSYFSSWSEDISKKLSFIYNLMANVSYTYTPAFKQFGRNVKVVQFLGSSKPWHVKFFSRTGQISPDNPVHPTYAQFVHVWINIFRVAALRQLPQDIRSYAQSQEVICAVELLRFFPLPLESEADFYLTPPSVRMRLAERRLQASPTTSKASLDARRRKSAEFPVRSVAERHVERLDATTDVEHSDAKGNVETELQMECLDVNAKSADVSVGSEREGERSGATSGVDAGLEEVALPGSAVGNYQGMKAWEQGRMDYQGTDSSDTIIKRLQFLMSQPK